MNNQAAKTKVLYTIGYSGFTIDEFVMILKKHGINAIADVRSVPYSRYKPEFNSKNLKEYLKTSGIEYVFLGDLCGARIEDQECYKDGKVDYSLIAKHPKFKDGLKRIKTGLEKYRITLLCAEKDPVFCHRMILICRNLRSEDIKIFHIMDSNVVLTQNECEERLLKLFKLDQAEFFKNSNEQIVLLEMREAHTLVSSSELQMACLLCSEPIPDKCHRRLVAEYLKNHFDNIEIQHL